MACVIADGGCSESIEVVAAGDPSREKLEEWRKVWEQCTRLEKSFWDMAMNLS